MRQLRYDESPRHRLRLADGSTIPGGQEFPADDDLAEHLLASEVPVTETIPPPTIDDDEGTTKEENPDG